MNYVRLLEYTCANPKNHISANIEGHHIIPLDKGGEDKYWNLISLCRKCHKKGKLHTEWRESKLELFVWKCMLELKILGFVLDEQGENFKRRRKNARIDNKKGSTEHIGIKEQNEFSVVVNETQDKSCQTRDTERQDILSISERRNITTEGKECKIAKSYKKIFEIKKRSYPVYIEPIFDKGYVTRRKAEKLTGKRRTSLGLWLAKHRIKPAQEIRNGRLYYLYVEAEILRRLEAERIV